MCGAGTIRGMVQGMYRDPRTIAALPVGALVFDYTLTFLLSGSREFLLQYEASPLLRYAVALDLVPLLVLLLVAFYYAAALLVLRALAGTDLYPLGVALVVLVSLTHLLGGMSWYVKNTLYSDTVIGLSLISIMVAVVIFGYAIIGHHYRVTRGQSPGSGRNGFG